MIFRQQHLDTFDFIVTDNSMLPRFTPGEYVAGVKCTGRAIKDAVGQDCIVQTKKGGILLRNVREKTGENTYTLACTNMNETKRPVLYDVEVAGLAPVIWQRRPAI